MIKASNHLICTLNSHLEWVLHVTRPCCWWLYNVSAFPAAGSGGPSCVYTWCTGTRMSLCIEACNHCPWRNRHTTELDRYFQESAGVLVGQVRQCQVLDIKFVVLSNNVSIDAATSSIINVELTILKSAVHLYCTNNEIFVLCCLLVFEFYDNRSLSTTLRKHWTALLDYLWQ
jgi:hypothetical protein